jgi:WD repeat-containing protein 7
VDVNTVITFYATSLGQLVGRLYKTPSLSCLARSWFQFSGVGSRYMTNLPLTVIYVDEFRGPARLLLDAGIARMTDEESASVVELLQHCRKFIMRSTVVN